MRYFTLADMEAYADRLTIGSCGQLYLDASEESCGYPDRDLTIDPEHMGRREVHDEGDGRVSIACAE